MHLNKPGQMCSYAIQVSDEYAFLATLVALHSLTGSVGGLYFLTSVVLSPASLFPMKPTDID